MTNVDTDTFDPATQLTSRKYKDLSADERDDLRRWWMDTVADVLPLYEYIAEDVARELPEQKPTHTPFPDHYTAVHYSEVIRVFVCPHAEDVGVAEVAVLTQNCASEYRISWRFGPVHEGCYHKGGISVFGGATNFAKAADFATWQDWCGELVCKAEKLRVMVVMPDE